MTEQEGIPGAGLRDRIRGVSFHCFWPVTVYMYVDLCV